MILRTLSLLIAVAWLPVAWKFVGAWRSRRNPISLAIVGLILFVIYVAVCSAWLHGYTSVNTKLIIQVLYTLCALICGNFYFAFWKSYKHFKDSRSRDG